jgi:hypothetical protein
LYVRLLLIGYFAGLDSERGLAWRAVDSLLPSLNVATTDSLTLCPVSVNETVSGVRFVRTSDTGCGGAVGGTGEVDSPQPAIPNTVTQPRERTYALGPSGRRGIFCVAQ